MTGIVSKFNSEYAP